MESECGQVGQSSGMTREVVMLWSQSRSGARGHVGAKGGITHKEARAFRKTTIDADREGVSGQVVDPANLDWNLLLADLRKLSAIVENEEEENTVYEKPAAPTVRQKQPASNHSRL